MDIILEFLLELIFGSIFESKTVKVRTKTGIMLLAFLAVEGLFAFCLYCLFRQGDRPFVTLAMMALTVWFAWIGIREIISGHRRGWKQN